jgi:transposase DDE domain
MSLLNLCEELEDPRIERNREHTLEVIVYLSLAAVICGAESWNEIERFGISKFSFFKRRFPYLVKIPSHDTFNRFFSLLKPDYFESVFRSWVYELCGKYEGVVAIDGKTIRGASRFDPNHPRDKKGFKLHMVSAWAVSNNLSLGQVKVDDKSNEITAIPTLIQALDLKDCIVTIDAIACQTDIAEAIVDGGADYVLALKGNQKNTLVKVTSWLGGMDHIDVTLPTYSSRYARYVTEEVSHGRIEKRECLVFTPGTTMELMLGEKFKGVKSVVKITSERLVMASKECSKENRYYITSIGLDASKIANAIRSHWAIENNLHWQLDVTFGEDVGRKLGNTAQNFSLINKIALQIIKKDELKASMKAKRKSAGWDEKYLERLLERANI